MTEQKQTEENAAFSKTQRVCGNCKNRSDGKKDMCFLCCFNNDYVGEEYTCLFNPSKWVERI